MLAIGTRIKCCYNDKVVGKVMGYGTLARNPDWSYGGLAGDAELSEPVYLVALTERIDLTKMSPPRMVSVMIIEERHAEEVRD